MQNLVGVEQEAKREVDWALKEKWKEEGEGEGAEKEGDVWSQQAENKSKREKRSEKLT